MIRIDVSAERKKQLDFIGLTIHELELLQRYRPVFEQIVDKVVDRLYDHIGKIEELNTMINEHSTIERLKGTQRWYFLSLADGVIDEAFIERRIKIGLVHSHIGLNTDFYLGTYMVYLDLSTQYMKEVLPDQWHPVIHALSKMFNLDSQLVLEAYEGKEKDKINEIVDEQNVLLRAITDVSQRLTGMIDELHSNTEVISRSAGETAASQESTHGLIDDLHQEVQHIGKMGTLIREISDQSHLLGLNAAIESAHAGESGRGFAIVADEIRKLAAGSRQAMEQIQKVVNSIMKKLAEVRKESEITSQNTERQVHSSKELIAFVQMMEDVSRDLKELQKR